MNAEERWTAVDVYLTELLVRPDSALNDALAASAAADLPAINVSPPQGKFLGMLAQLMGARRILEIGCGVGLLLQHLGLFPRLRQDREMISDLRRSHSGLG